MLTRIRARLPLGRDPSKTSKKKTKIQKTKTKNTKTTIDFCSPRGTTQSTLIPELRTAHKHQFNSVDFFLNARNDLRQEGGLFVVLKLTECTPCSVRGNISTQEEKNSRLKLVTDNFDVTFTSDKLSLLERTLIDQHSTFRQLRFTR